VITLYLLPHAEKLAPDNPLGLSRAPLYHQMRTFDALGGHPLVVNSYDTGTGKTVAALLGLLHQALRDRNCLFIAPTNELLRQHERDIQDFLAAHGLDYHTIRVDATMLRTLPQAYEHERVGERLVRLVSNPQAYNSGWDGHKPLVVITNPDIFYYALYFSAYSPHDRRNLFEQFLTRFDYVIMDEFHYYSAKQLANFLFFFVIVQEWGYSGKGRRICLLSATPEEAIRKYLTRIFPEPGAIAWLSPANEPPESADYSTAPALTPLTLQVREGTLNDFADDPRQREWLAGLLEAGQDGALISNALWRVNQAHAALRGPRFDGRTSRLTGAETPESRQTAPQFPLILATPTVDIGYNFGKTGKHRQPLDFVVFDARTRDEFLQRMGRAGRVLGREQTDLPARAVALVDADALTALRPLDGQTLPRAELRRVVQQALPPRNDLFAYVRSYAVLEAFRPIYELKRTMRPDLEEWVERLFEKVRKVFAPNPGNQYWYYGSLCRRMRHHVHIGHVVREGRTTELSDFVDEFLDWHRPMGAPPQEWARLEQTVRTDHRSREQLVAPWLKAQYALTEALFNFRESFQGPTAAVYDPHHLLSDSNVTFYDALHVAANFESDYFDDAASFHYACGAEPGQAEVYCRLTACRDPRLYIGLEYREGRLPREVWERLYTRRPVALSGLRLRAQVPSGGVVALPPALRRSIEAQHVACLIVPDADVGHLLYLARDRNLFPRSLQVTFAVQGTSHEYRAMIGTAAFVVHAELEGYFGFKQNQNNNIPIIL
jgi:CRISPR-associated endonuclease/helicase Cas3